VAWWTVLSEYVVPETAAQKFKHVLCASYIGYVARVDIMQSTFMSALNELKEIRVSHEADVHSY
jgi:hypothetical protein